MLINNSVYGLTNKSLSVSKNQSKANIEENSILQNNKIYNFFLFNKSGICILEKQIETIFKNPEEYYEYKLLIKKIAHTLLINNEKSEFKKKINNKTNENVDKLNLNSIKNNPKENEFIFKSIFLEKFKILILLRNNITFVSTFPIKSSTQFQRLLLIHIFIALINFKADAILSFQKFNEYEKYDNNNFTCLKSFLKNKLNFQSKEINDILELLLFENYFLKVIIVHFSKVFNEIFKKEFLKLNQTKFKNLYVLDLATSSIILDMCKIQNTKEDNQDNNYIINEKLFEEILFHSKNMNNSYRAENDMKFFSTDSEYRFVKLECTSTFPRLLFIIKYIPVLNGITVIHLYYQKKLSRNMENNLLDQEIKYKEIDLLFGSDIKVNQNLEFKYGAPKKLQHIEKFFEEFFITNRNGFGIFRVNNNKKFRYVNYNIINIVNSVPVSNNVNINRLFEDINKRLEEEYDKEINTKKEKELMNNNKDNESKDESQDEDEDENEEKIYNNLFSLKKETFYNEILNLKYKDNNNLNVAPIKNMNKKQISKIFDNSKEKSLISEDDKKDIDIKIDKTFKNTAKMHEMNSNVIINTENLIYTQGNSERKKLIKKNKEISWSNSFSKIDNFSMISEVKSKEIFKIKVFNIKGQKTKDKNNDIYNVSKEKDYKLSELLDITEINPKNNKINEKSVNANINQKESNEKNITIKNTESKNLISDSASETKKE